MSQLSPGALLIDGAWVQGQGTAFNKTNPVTNQQVWAGHEANQVDVEQACNAARLAFPCLGSFGVRRAYRDH